MQPKPTSAIINIISIINIKFLIMGTVIAGAGAEDQEEDSCEGEEEAVEAKPGARRSGLRGGEILIEADVFDGGEGEGEALGELDAADDGEGDEAVEEGHEAGEAEEEEGGGGAEAGGGYLGGGEVGGFGDGDGGDGLHGLDGHGEAEEEAGGDVVEGCEDEGRREVQV